MVLPVENDMIVVGTGEDNGTDGTDVTDGTKPVPSVPSVPPVLLFTHVMSYANSPSAFTPTWIRVIGLPSDIRPSTSTAMSGSSDPFKI